MAEQLRRVAEAHEFIDERPSEEAGRYVPLRKFPGTASIRGRCCDCGLEQTHTIGALLKSGISPMTTVNNLERTEKCLRMGCGGDMQFDIEIPE